MSAETTTGQGSGQASPHGTETDPLLWEEFFMAKCLGPAGTWGCALPFGHEGDHVRFAPEPQPESSLTAHQLELLAGVRALRQERDELLLLADDLLGVVKAVLNGHEHVHDIHGSGCWICVALCAALAKAEAR